MLLVARGLRSRLAGPFDLDLQTGTCLAITGPSGSGKSLLLRMVADLDPHDGEAWLSGTARTSIAAPRWRTKVTLAAAEPGWWHDRVGPHFTGPPDLARLGLPDSILGREVSACSTGERSRLGLLRALAGQPEVLLADEPTGPLDPAASEAVESLLSERLHAGLALILVTHDHDQALRLATQHRRMDGGRFV